MSPQPNDKIVNHMFLVLCILSITLPILFFLIINNPKKINLINFGKENSIIYSIDSCQIKDNVLSVEGWAAPVSGIDKGNNKNKIYLTTYDGLVLIKAFIKKRPDVSAHYNKTGVYDFSGFSGSINLIFNKQNKIALLILADNGSEKGYTRHVCE